MFFSSREKNISISFFNQSLPYPCINHLHWVLALLNSGEWRENTK